MFLAFLFFLGLFFYLLIFFSVLFCVSSVYLKGLEEGGGCDVVVVVFVLGDY